MYSVIIEIFLYYIFQICTNYTHNTKCIKPRQIKLYHYIYLKCILTKTIIIISCVSWTFMKYGRNWLLCQDFNSEIKYSWNTLYKFNLYECFIRIYLCICIFRTAKNRSRFSVLNFAKKYNLSEPPIGGNYFFAQYDEYVSSLDTQFGS